VLTSGWALKENRKYRKKGGGKRIPKHIITILQSLFLAGNVDKTNRSSPQEMLRVLNEKAQNGEIDPEGIPEEKTIQNWIARYAAAFKKASAEKALQ
jgi:hypothetical protein